MALAKILASIPEPVKNTIRRTIISHHRRSGAVLFSDTTLRDGEQMPGATLAPEDKVDIARALAEAGVHSLDAGFPACAPSEIEAIQRIVRAVNGPVITALCRTIESDIDAAAEALRDALPMRRGVSLFLATSPIHREHKLGKSKGEIIDILRSSIGYARRTFEVVAFSPEDASRTEIDFLCEVYRQAIDAGATTVGLPDTVGLLTPEKVREFARTLQDRVANFDRALFAVHFHNDLGLATANTLAALEEGANIVQCTVNGIGERAGNASLEEVVMALVLHPDQYRRKLKINPAKLTSLSRLVAERTGIAIAPNKAVVGENIFATEAGIHQDGLLKHQDTYLPFRPEVVGAEGVRLVLGKHSGRRAVAQRLLDLGHELSRPQVDRVIERIKSLEKGTAVDDALLQGLVDEVATEAA